MSTTNDLKECVLNIVDMKIALKKYRAPYEREKALNERLLDLLGKSRTEVKGCKSKAGAQ